MKRTRIDWAKAVTVRETIGQAPNFKPAGFWYSVDEDWERWCRSEQPDWLEDRYVHQVTLGDERILAIRTSEELDRFHQTYRADFVASWYVDWPVVAAAYDGIEIAPYQWNRRNFGDPRWYYTWDCASGCIWRPRGVTVDLLEDR